jgi:hypothetical protein
MTPAKPGRPRLPPAERLVTITFRVTPAEALKLRALGPGGRSRLRDWLRRQP